MNIHANADTRNIQIGVCIFLFFKTTFLKYIFFLDHSQRGKKPPVFDVMALNIFLNIILLRPNDLETSSHLSRNSEDVGSIPGTGR